MDLPSTSHAREDLLKAVDECGSPGPVAGDWGFPHPRSGVHQSPTPALVHTTHFFVDDATWNEIQDHGKFDDIVVGSGFCALAYVDKALELDPFRRILILERGGFLLPTHFQNIMMPRPYKVLLGGPSETYPWQLSPETVNTTHKFVHGSCPFFGGRSTFWSGWSPRASKLMRDFPLSMLDTANSENFWKDCEELLHVVAANKISSPIFGQRLQALVYGRLKKAVDANKIETVDSVDHAALAVGRRTSIGTVEFSKFSTPGPLLALQQKQRHLANEGKGSPLTIATDTIVQRFETDPEDPLNRPSILHTSRGALRFSKTTTNLVLAAGAFPNTTILMNSVGEQLKGRAGSRVSGHFLTQIVARFPIPRSAENPERPLFKHLEIGAHYMAGKDSTSDLQYHVQITAIHSPRPETDAEDAARLSPDQAGAATFEQLKDSGQHIVLVCAALGELDELDTGSWFKHDPNNPDVTTNSHLQVLLSEKAERLWDVMDQVTYDAINVMAGGVSNDIEYWSHSNVPSVPPGWSRDQPPQCMIRVPGIVHETATLYMSDDLETDPHASVDSDYRPHSCHNVFVTGGALFPTSGSWNPTLTMCGFAQDLAKKLHEVRKSETSSPS